MAYAKGIVLVSPVWEAAEPYIPVGHELSRRPVRIYGHRPVAYIPYQLIIRECYTHSEGHRQFRLLPGWRQMSAMDAYGII